MKQSTPVRIVAVLGIIAIILGAILPFVSAF